MTFLVSSSNLVYPPTYDVFSGILIQVREALRPDGFFLAGLLGGDTLFELRTALQVAEQEREGGISPHVSPMTGIDSLLHDGLQLICLQIPGTSQTFWGELASHCSPSISRMLL